MLHITTLLHELKNNTCGSVIPNIYGVITTEHLSQLAKYLETNTVVTTLNFSGGKSVHPIEYNLDIYKNIDWGEALCDTFHHNKSITHADFSYGYTNDYGIALLSRALYSNTTLVSLNLSNCLIGPNGAKELSYMLEHNSTLKELDLGLNKLGVRGGEELVLALNKNTGLTSIKLNATNIDINSFSKLNSNKTLKSLTISIHKVSHRTGDIAPFCEYIKNNDSLDYLYVEFGELTLDNIRDLENARSHNKRIKCSFKLIRATEPENSCFIKLLTN